MPTRRVFDTARNPAQLVVAAFVLGIGLGTALLSLPIAVDDGSGLPLEDALFSATSAITVTGLGTVNVEELSIFGELVTLGLVQIGGFGIMTIGAVLALFLAGSRVGIRQSRLAQAEIGAVDYGELRKLIRAIFRTTVIAEVTVGLVLALRFWITHGDAIVPSLYSGLFHSVSAFNNAGIGLRADSLIRYQDDPLVLLVVSAAFILGGLGFPIVVQLAKRVKWRQLTLHAKVTLAGTGVLLVLGPLLVLLFEWTNPATLGPLPIVDKVANGWFAGTSPRTAGFNALDIGALNETTLVGTVALMFIGAGPASTAGGIKVTTFALLGYVLWSEVRGDVDTNVLHRRIPSAVIRQAITVVILAIGSIMAVTMVILSVTELTLTPALFEATSAFATVGLSTGVTADLPTIGKLALVALMLAGRVGPTTLVTALAFRQRAQAFRYPEEAPIIG